MQKLFVFAWLGLGLVLVLGLVLGPRLVLNLEIGLVLDLVVGRDRADIRASCG